MVLSDDTSDLEALHAVKSVIADRARVTHAHNPDSSAAPFSIGLMRDLGAEAAQDGLVLFNDVDFFAPRRIYRGLARAFRRQKLHRTRGAFACAPVAFLTRLGTAAARRAPMRIWPALGGETARTLGLVDRVVLGSSAMAMDRRTLLEIGGHSRDFQGHGAEDFELMDRLCRAYPRGPRPPNYAEDYGSRSERNDGFRHYFGRYGGACADQGLFLAHLWHPPRREDPRYQAARERNFEKLAEMMRSREAQDEATGSGPRAGAAAGPRPLAAE